MKTFSFGLLMVLGLILPGCSTCKQANPDSNLSEWKTSANDVAPQPVALLRITANVDGSGKFVFTPESARYEHKNWSPPTDVAINGRPWNDLGHTLAGWSQFSDGLDLSRAWIVEREGRDVIALEQTAKGFDLYLDDSPNGSADYSVTIAIPRRE